MVAGMIRLSASFIELSHVLNLINTCFALQVLDSCIESENSWQTGYVLGAKASRIKPVHDESSHFDYTNHNAKQFLVSLVIPRQSVSIIPTYNPVVRSARDENHATRFGKWFNKISVGDYFILLCFCAAVLLRCYTAVLPCLMRAGGVLCCVAPF